MRLALVFVMAMVAGGGAAAQDASPVQAPGSTPADAATASQDSAPASADLPVSLRRIRQGLKKQVADSLLLRPEIPADFRVQILEQRKIDDMLSKLDFKTGQSPAPAGGLYGYEQQRRLFNPVDRPLAQPYAAFSGGELIMIAIENLIGRYVANRLANGIVSAERARAEREARDEVHREIAAYCETRPDRAEITICALPSDR